jgi:predicted AlkP superfamily phosphohydrolase/phosphomutase
LLDALDDDVTILGVSDHGFGVEDGSLFLNSWLRKRGLLKLRGWKVKVRLAANTVLGATMASKLERISKKLQRPSQFGEALALQGEYRARQFDLESSGAVAVGSYYSGIYLAGAQEERRSLAERLKKELEGGAISDRRGNAVSGAFLGEEVYDGPHVEDGPDLTIVPRPGLSIANVATRRGVVALAGEPYGPKFTGCHRPEGIVIVVGPGAKQGQFETANLVDVCPTILAILGLDVPKDLDGAVQEGWFEKGLTYRQGDAVSPKDVSSEYTTEERAAVEQRLSDLGYL